MLPDDESRPGGRVLVSACLLGVDCRYDGGNRLREELVEFARKEGAVPICPEQLGGLSTPRDPSEIVGGQGGGCPGRQGKGGLFGGE